MLSTINNAKTCKRCAGVCRGGGRGVEGVGALCRVQVNSEQVGLESLAEAGERLIFAVFDPAIPFPHDIFRFLR